MIFQIFGSKYSQDYDVLVFVDKIGSIKENHETITRLDNELALILTDKPINCNIAVLENGLIKQVFKGYPLEVNNSAYHTFKNHKQYHPNQVTNTYELTDDIKHLKLKRCLRFILSFYSRVPEWRADVKSAMRGNLELRLKQISKIDFLIHNQFPEKKDSLENIYKTFAFQLAQTYLLINDIEVYSKEDVIKHLPKLKESILRKETGTTELSTMNSLLSEIIDYGYNEMKYMKSLYEDIMTS